MGESMIRKQQMERRTQQILHTALKLFCEKGIEYTSVEEIAILLKCDIFGQRYQTPGEISEIEVPPGKSLKRYGKYIPSVGVRLVSDMRFGTGTPDISH